MRAVVKTPFIDKYTGQFYEAGLVLELSDERIKEMKSAGDFLTVQKRKGGRKTNDKRGNSDAAKD